MQSDAYVMVRATVRCAIYTLFLLAMLGVLVEAIDLANRTFSALFGPYFIPGASG